MRKIALVLLGLLCGGILYAQGGPELKVQRKLNFEYLRDPAPVPPYQLTAICDEGNGVMLYFAWGYHGAMTVAAVPNGCKKALQ